MDHYQSKKGEFVDTSLSSRGGKVIHIGNISRNINQNWLENYLRNTTKGFQRLLVLREGGRTQYALASYKSHSAASDAIDALEGEPHGPQGTPIVVGFKTKKGEQAADDQRNRREPRRRPGGEEDTSKKAEEKNKAAKKFTQNAVTRNDKGKAPSMTSKEAHYTTKSAKKGAARETCAPPNKGRDKHDGSRARADKITSTNIKEKPRKAYDKGQSFHNLDNRSYTRDMDSFTSSDSLLRNFPALQRYQQSKMTQYSDHTCSVNFDTDQQSSHDDPSTFLLITGTSGEVVDSDRLFEFFERALPSRDHIVQCLYKNGEALLEMSNVISAQTAHEVLSGKQLSQYGAPIEVRYVEGISERFEEEYEKSDNLVDASEVESIHSTSTAAEHDNFNQGEQKKVPLIMLITVGDSNLRNRDFKLVMSQRGITVDKMRVNHPQNNTVAVVSFSSQEEVTHAEEKLEGLLMGNPAEVIKIEVNCPERKKNRRRNRRRKRQQQKGEFNENDNLLTEELIDPADMAKTEERCVDDFSDDQQVPKVGDVGYLELGGQSNIVDIISDDSQGNVDDNHDSNIDDGDGDNDDYDDGDKGVPSNTSTSVSVRNIDKDIAEYQIRQFLTEQDIDARGLTFFKSSSGNRGNYAVVQFEYPEEASEALQILKDQMGVYGDNLVVTFAENTPGELNTGARRGKTGHRGKRGPEGRNKHCQSEDASDSRLTPNTNSSKVEQTINQSKTGIQRCGNKPDANSNSKTNKRDIDISSNNVVIDDLPKMINESDIAEVVWKFPKLRSGFKNSRLVDTRAVLEFSTEVAAMEAVAELHFVRVKGHVLKARLAVHNPDLDKLMLRKQREALITHITETGNTIEKQIEEKINDLFLEITNTDDDMLRDTLQHKLDETQGFHDEFKQTFQHISQHADNLMSEDSPISDTQASLLQLDELCRRLEREGRRLKSPLPIYGSRTQILEVVTNEETRACVIQAETGSGKSTQVPQYLIESINQQIIYTSKEKAEHGIICTQPRRIAAITLAQRIAEEYGCDVGEEVGFIAGNRKKVSDQTLATFMTDRALLSQCLADANYLDRYRYVIIDEAHERSVDTDILIAMLKKEQQQNRQITIIIMSATIDVDLFSRYFDECPVVTIPGRTFPVDVEWFGAATDGHGGSGDNYVSRAVQKSYDVHVNEDIEGDVLVFLTSQNEIDRACNDLKQKLGIRAEEDECVDILPLHGKLQPQDQFKVFRKTTYGRRKIVFATNIAETSVTIPGVKYVIDTGMVKELQYDTKKSMSMLKVTSVTQASAEQRRGRAGRTGPGKCYRLYSQEEYEEMEQNMKPEILRVHLGMAVIQLLQMGVKDIKHFQFVESPEPGAIEQAMKSLFLLGAITENGMTLTDLGYQMGKLPLEPRLAKMILEGAKYGFLEDAIAMAALISAPGNVYYQGGSDAERKVADQLKLRFCVEDGDVITLLGIFREWQGIKGDRPRNKWCKDNSLNAKTLRVVQENVDELKLTITRSKGIEHLRKQKPTQHSTPSSKENSMSKDASQLETQSDPADRMINSALPGEVTHEVTLFEASQVHSDIPENNCNKADAKPDDPNKTLRKILMSAYFENLSVYNGHIRAGYTVASQLKTAVFHPSSALAVLNSRPEWVIYGELRRTSRDFLCVVTPVDINWIHEVAPAEFSKHIDIEKLKACVMNEMRVEPIGTAIMRELSRKRFEGVRKMEDDITSKSGVPCIIEAKFDNGSLDVFIATHSKSLANDIVKKSLEDIKSGSLRERIEVPVGTYGSVRHVVKAGGETDFILMTEDDFITVEWSGVSEETQEEVLRQGLEEQGVGAEDIVQIFKYPKHWTVAKQGKWGKTTFVSPEKAQDAVDCGSLIDPFGEINLEPILPDMRKRALAAGIQGSASINTKINVTWYTGRSKGIAFVDCADFDDATSVIQSINGTHLRGKCIRCARGRKNTHSAYVSQLDANVTPEELEEHIKRRTGATTYRTFVPREKQDDMIPISDAVYKRNLRTLFREISDIVEVNVLQERGVKRKAFITLGRNLGKASRQELHCLMGYEHQSPGGELYRMKQIVTCDLYCSQQVFRSVRDELHRGAEECEECEVQCEDTKRTPPDKRIHIFGEAYSEVATLRRKLQTIIRPEVLHADDLITEEVSPVWIDKVLNKLTTGRLSAMLRKSKAHAYIDVRRQAIMVYGKADERESLKSDLKEYFTDALNTMFREVDLSSRSCGQKGKAMRTLILQFGPGMERLKARSGVDNITVDLKSGTLFVDGREDAYNRLVEAVDDNLKVMRNSKTDVTSEAEPDECGACFCLPADSGSKPYRLAACGHFFCLTCLKDHLKASSSSKKFPITCPGCDEPIMLCDIKTVYPQEDQRLMLFKAGLDAYIVNNPNENIKFCPGVDCCMVYTKDDGGETQDCDECGYSFCNCCGKEAHPDDMNCKEFHVSQEESNDVDKWIENEGVDAKKCPVCKIMIEKEYGCNHMVCEYCKSHICWNCLQVFDSDIDCYDHLQTVQCVEAGVPNEPRRLFQPPVVIDQERRQRQEEIQRAEQQHQLRLQRAERQRHEDMRRQLERRREIQEQQRQLQRAEQRRQEDERRSRIAKQQRREEIGRVEQVQQMEQLEYWRRQHEQRRQHDEQQRREQTEQLERDRERQLRQSEQQQRETERRRLAATNLNAQRHAYHANDEKQKDKKCIIL